MRIKVLKKGFTVIELVVVLMIAGILFLCAIPGIHFLIQKNRAMAKVNELVSAINYGRSEAIKRGAIITFCKSADHKSCNGTWRDGQILFEDHNGSGQITEEDKILRVYQPLPEGAQLIWYGFRSNDYIQMHPIGMGKAMSGHFDYIPDMEERRIKKTLTISQAGRIRIS